jgi:transcriptional regulator with XRE-family HTH domain
MKSSETKLYNSGLYCFDNSAKLIKTRRADKSLTLERLAEMLGINNPQSISNAESGNCHIPAKRLRKYCEVLNIDISEMKDAMLKDRAITIDNFFKKF